MAPCTRRAAWPQPCYSLWHQAQRGHAAHRARPKAHQHQPVWLPHRPPPPAAVQRSHPKRETSSLKGSNMGTLALVASAADKWRCACVCACVCTCRLGCIRGVVVPEGERVTSITSITSRGRTRRGGGRHGRCHGCRGCRRHGATRRRPVWCRGHVQLVVVLPPARVVPGVAR